MNAQMLYFQKIHAPTNAQEEWKHIPPRPRLPTGFIPVGTNILHSEQSTPTFFQVVLHFRKLMLDRSQVPAFQVSFMTLSVEF